MYQTRHLTWFDTIYPCCFMLCRFYFMFFVLWLCKDAFPLPHHYRIYLIDYPARVGFRSLTYIRAILPDPYGCEKWPLTAFACEEGLFEYVVLPMRLTNAPATIQRTMSSILEEGIRARFLIVFIDAEYSNSLEEHEKHLNWLISKLTMISVYRNFFIISKQNDSDDNNQYSNGDGLEILNG